MKKMMILASIPLLILVGCGGKKAAPVQTVDWYLAHDAERKATQQECRNNPGELGRTPNCVNATVATRMAASRITVHQRF